MQLALGLAVVFIGADLAISGITKRGFTRLLLGNWDAPGSTPASTSKSAAPGNALTGGAHAPTGATGTPGHSTGFQIPAPSAGFAIPR